MCVILSATTEMISYNTLKSFYTACYQFTARLTALQVPIAVGKCSLLNVGN